MGGIKVFRFDVRSDIPELVQRLGPIGEKAAHALAIQARKDTSPYVPARNGDLDRRTKVEESKIIYPGPQSRYLYHGHLMVDPETGSSFAPYGATKVLTDKDLVFSTAMHAQAQAYWFEASKAENKNKWKRVLKEAIRHYL